MHDSTTPFWLQSNENNINDSQLPLLHFVHGNSFPTGTYSAFLSHLKSSYRIRALEMHGHNPAYPVSDSWPELCKELIASLETNQGQPAILLGHSLGGMLSMMVATMRPDLVRCVLMLDSPVVAGWRAKLLFIGKKLGLTMFVPPAKFAKKRRQSWPDKEAAFQHFAAKEMFAIWPEQVLRDYIDYGTEPYPRGVTLRFKRSIETAIYCTLPHGNKRLRRLPFPVPIGFICGTTSVECRQAGIYHTQQLVQDNFEWIEGGHLYPLESPKVAADKAHAMIQQLLLQIPINS